MSSFENTFGLCLFLPDRPTPREIARACGILREIGDRIVCVLTSRQGREAISARLGADAPAIADTKWVEPDAVAELRADAAALGIGAMVSLSEAPDADAIPDIATHYGQWIILDCESLGDGGADALRRAIADGRDMLDISIRQLATSGQEAQTIAHADRIPRRPWDGLGRLQNRLDARISDMLVEACERLENGEEFAEPPRAGATKNIRPRKTNWRQRATDFRYFVHLLGMAWSRVHRFKQLKIVCLHNPHPDILDQNLAAFSRMGPFIRFSDVERQIREGGPLPPGLIITFDDGYKQNMALLDVLDKHDCKAVFFVATASVDSPAPLWFMNQDKVTWQGKAHLKSLSYGDFMKTLDETGLTAESALRGRFGLRAEEMRTLIDRGHEIAVHTHNHPFMRQLQADEIRYEIQKCHERLRRLTGEDDLPLHFAYPDGGYDQRVADVLQDLNVSTAMTLDCTPVRPGTHPMKIPRYPLDDPDYPGMAVLKQTDGYRMYRSP